VCSLARIWKDRNMSIAFFSVIHGPLPFYMLLTAICTRRAARTQTSAARILCHVHWRIFTSRRDPGYVVVISVPSPPTCVSDITGDSLAPAKRHPAPPRSPSFGCRAQRGRAPHRGHPAHHGGHVRCAREQRSGRGLLHCPVVRPL